MKGRIVVEIEKIPEDCYSCGQPDEYGYCHYLLSKKQLKHVIKLERFWNRSYADEEKNEILKKLKTRRNRYGRS